MKNKNIFKFILLVFIVTSHFEYTSAQYYREHGDNDGKWHILLEPYLMAPYINGTLGLGTEPPVPPIPDVKVRQTPGDIFNNLKMKGLLSGEVYNKDWSISTDIIYMKLGTDVVHESGIASGDVSLNQFNWEVAGMYRFLPWLEGGLALQLNYLKTTLNAEINIAGGPFPISKEGSQTWLDPSIVGRAYYAFTDSKKWFVQCRANIGGFGIGSKIYWQAQPYVGYYFSRVFQMSAGYRLISMNYEQGRGSDRFLYNVVTHGPVIKLGFNIY